MLKLTNATRSFCQLKEGGDVRLLLLPFSAVYYAILVIWDFFWRKGIFKARALDARVISVGNITWGGTGKTPAVAAITKELLKNGSRPAILIRGYGNDEKDLLPRLISEVPVVVGRDRVKTGKAAIARHGADTILLDDGFQHRRLKRDLDIVCIDATAPFGNGCVMPAGSMREGLGSLKRSGVFLLTKVDLAQDTVRLEEKLKKINPNALIVKSIHAPGYFYKLSNEQLVDIEGLKGKNIALVSAIGNPSSFEKTISNLGLGFKKHFIFRDHHFYAKRDLESIEDYCKENNIVTIITTEKDAVKLKAISYQLSAISFLVLHIELKIIDNEQRLYSRLNRIHIN
ncbi:MAG: tetraacyldisaccharide 4'-kinase [Candidatus Omnitrophica bacterium]|nr:tetraacyldisaccharide 4'-kinase [Candidatus Omnitrophota bacterium]MBU4590776.1 tetraacyldisaccharide 4'-kinase [Candidatus Omnitrophota bacterium]